MPINKSTNQKKSALSYSVSWFWFGKWVTGDMGTLYRKDGVETGSLSIPATEIQGSHVSEIYSV